MPDLTIFSAPKPFSNPHIATIQHNAIASWLALAPRAETFLVGQEDGLAEAAQTHGVPLLSNVRRNDSGTPLVSSIFDLARQAGTAPYLAYVNGDIVLLPDLLDGLGVIAAALPKRPFLLIGQRWDLDITTPLDTTPGWHTRLRQDVAQRGVLHKPAGSDYFVFPLSAFTEMPDFAIGRAGWDNWMIYYARHNGWPVIDGTPQVTIVHQNHDYSHLPGGRPHYDLDESQVNMKLAGGLAHMYMVLDADYQLRAGRLERAPLTWLRLLRSIERRLTPPNGRLRGPRGALARRFRRLRRNYYG